MNIPMKQRRRSGTSEHGKQPVSFGRRCCYSEPLPGEGPFPDAASSHSHAVHYAAEVYVYPEMKGVLVNLALIGANMFGTCQRENLFDYPG